MTAASVLVVEDDETLREALCDTLEIAGYSVISATEGASALELLETHTVGLVISDVQMRPMDGRELMNRIRGRMGDCVPVILMTAYGTIERAVEAIRSGATDYLVKPFAADALLELVERVMPDEGLNLDEPVATEPRTRELLTLARRVAATEATVMLTGESGTGKEVMARFIHQQSPRRDEPFVALNCAAIPENMLEAVLFGYEKGAFTGAHKSNPGKFELAQGGTLLLDEVSEMALGLQAKLLRVLQEREVERLGGQKMIPLDVRVLATSNRNLREEVAQGHFREDLYYRLNVFPLNLPPLRERRGDILPLARRILARSTPEGRPIPTLSEAAGAQLEAYEWPGNVRELDNVLQRALILQMGSEIQAADLMLGMEPDAVAVASPASKSEPPTAAVRGGLGDDLRQAEQRLILDALRAGKGSRKRAAEHLGISPRTLRYKLARLREAGVEIPD
ncbi:MAG: sigma-54 dependent transcriptional regulator [Pseudomonadota bacterium]|nr:sigma-54 dependent transcriptional regulator [Pseudomonadota bacterium]